ncbi:P-loop containing nucleoside triphosphate hydrolase protein [Armillaria novae-zelandiae]|uniref:P-loop containing nucleoside triphosphate hydrolase protein n=1 Tax=Armillaria novae-zelandiae TaxID=153914 RepID=A0AA39U8I4_9AGAR|nr:P-loop containing nucleoside triphosphate hydrolase protein [Armillaria novae-zelandiae]
MSTLKQSFLPQECREIRIRHHSRRQAASAAEVLLNEKCLGISIVQARAGSDVEYLAIATPEEVAVISLSHNYGILPKDEPFRALLSAKYPVLAGFNMPRLSICLFCHLNYHVQAIDLSTFRSKTASNPYYPAKLLCETMAMKVDGFAVDSLWNDRLDEEEHETIRKVCLRAWISAIIIKRNLDIVQTIKPIETRWMKPETLVIETIAKVLACLGRLLSEADILQRAKPTEISNDFSEVKMDIILTTSDGRQFKGSPKKSRGKETEIKVRGGFSGTVASVKVIGREGGTNTEKARDELLLHALQGDCHLRHSKFKTVVSAMVSARSLVVAHGPPGTGKTSTISAAAVIWGRKKLPTWIVAHSNVAVKNIAEKLASSDVNFKIIVSKEFYVEWHEHLYTQIVDRLFRADELPNNPKDLGYTIGASTIILSTLSMLSNPALDDNGMFDLVPPKILVVDEASQINIFEYMHVFFKFRNVMNQVPPYGKDKAPSMQCIFDIDHLKDESYFLNIQYRMPHPLGEFISREVYNGRLRSEHRIKDPSCVAFIDTKTGMEERSGLSWQNASEIRTIVHLVKLYYKDRNFCIITPYDAQRAAIERELQSNNLPWERVFNVDSFQGNEADIVIVSVVRGREPGFLRSDQRMNLSSQAEVSLSGPGELTLVGKLARGKNWVEWTAVAEQRVNLPDAIGKHAFPHNSPATHQLTGTRPNFDVRALFRHPSSETTSGTRTFSALAC